MKNDPIHELAVYGRVGDLFGPDHLAPAGQAGVAFNNSRRVLREFQDAVSTIQTDPMLSDKGRQARAREIGERTLAELATLNAGPLQAARRARDRLHGQISAKGSNTSNDLAALLLAQEVRRHVLEHDQLVRENLLRDAIERGDATTVSAFLDAPQLFAIAR